MQATILIISIFSPLIAIWTGRRRYELLWWYSWACLISDVAFMSFKYAHIDAYWIYNLFTPIEFIFVTFFFAHAIFAGNVQKALKVLLALLAMYFLVSTSIKSFSKFNYTDAAFLYATFILFSILGLYKVIKEIEFVRIEQSRLFIFSIAFLMLASGSFIILLFESELVIAHKELVRGLWKLLHNPLNIIKNILIGYGLWLTKKRT